MVSVDTIPFLRRIPRPTRAIAAVIVGQKALLVTFLFILPCLFPKLFPNGRIESDNFEGLDVRYYLNIACQGYYGDQGESAFYPLWPVCIQVFSYFTVGHALLGVYVLANCISLAALLLFHRLAWRRHGLQVANRSTVLLLVYPASIFFFVPYTESLFLLLLMAFWICLDDGNIRGVIITSFLLPLTRATGCFVLPVLMWELFRRRSPARSYLLCAAPLYGYLCYFIIMYISTGNAFEGFVAQRLYLAQPSIANIFHPFSFARALANFHWEHDMLHSFIDRLVFIAFLLGLYAMLRLDSGYFVYALFAGLIPALSNDLMSFTRFSSLIFPMFIIWTKAARKDSCFLLLILLCWAIQVLFFTMSFAGLWVG